jgi:CBS domain-containing protein
VLRRFSVMRVGSLMTAGASPAPATGHRIGIDRSARDALALMLSAGVTAVLVVDGKGAVQGALTLADLERAARPAVSAR